MKTKSIATACAFLLIIIATVVMIGWVFEIPTLVQIFPGMVGMVFNTATCFILTGFLFLILNKPRFKHQQIIIYALLALIISISTASLLQDFTSVDFGIDRLFITPWLKDPNPTPGRMAPNTSVGFIMSALVGLLLPYGYKNRIALSVQVLTFLILVIALVGLLVYSLKLEFIFRWYHYTRMSIPTATCFGLTSIGWYALWNQCEWLEKFYKGREDKKIIFITGTILLCLTLIAALAGAATLTYLNFTSVERTLHETLQNKATLLVNTINTIEAKATAISNNPILINTLNNKKTISSDHLSNYIHSINSGDFSFFQVINMKGDVIAQEGNAITNASISIPISSVTKTNLFWNKGFWLDLTRPIYLEPQHLLIGSLRAQSFLENLTEDYLDPKGLGDTGETLICHKPKFSTKLECFPTRLSKTIIKEPFVIPNQTSSLQQDKNFIGILSTFDYRQEDVILDFLTLTKFGLIVINKIDADEIYKPIRNQIKYMFPAALFLISCGLILLYLEIVPLVRKVVLSEKEAKKAKKELGISLKQIKQKNKDIFALRELSGALQICHTLEEAEKIILKYGKQLLPNVAAKIYLMTDSHYYLENILEWGNLESKSELIHLDECWALRNGRVYKVKDTTNDLVCEHHKNTPKSYLPYICIPMLTQGEIMGLLYVVLNKINDEKEYKTLQNNAIIFSEQIALGLSNIRLQQKLREQSLRDVLTGLHNRRFLEEVFEKELHRIKRDSSTLAVLIFDIDHFKSFNDRYGHEAGDLVLKTIGNIVRNEIRKNDTACRYGGEEFIILMPNVSYEVAYERAKFLKTSISELHLKINTHELETLTISVGISISPNHGTKSQELIRAADIALYQAKNSGRNKIVVFQPSHN